MYQLFYTSAPKLLEAGKTGFGTIARCKSLPQPLVMYLERISTLDRQVGIAGYETYCSYKLGRDVFHIFSHIEDCGADYTGRTNHLAQHFIIEEGGEEFQALCSGTPAGTLLSMRTLWLGKAWSGGPAWLPELPAPTVLPSGSPGAWAQYTGHQNNAKWLNTYSFASGACLRGEDYIEDFVPLLHEALLERADHGWNVGFSTVCASNISIQRFPILCLGSKQTDAHVSAPRGIPELLVGRSLTPPPDNEIIVEHQEPVPETNGPLPKPCPQNEPVPSALCQPPVPENIPMPPPSVPAGSASGSVAGVVKREKKAANNYLPVILIGIAVVLLISFMLRGADKEEKPAKPQNPTHEAPENPAKQAQPAAKPETAPSAKDSPASESPKEKPNAEKLLKDKVEKAKADLLKSLQENFKGEAFCKLLDDSGSIIDELFSQVQNENGLPQAEADAKAKIFKLFHDEFSRRSEEQIKRGKTLKAQLDGFSSSDASKCKRNIRENSEKLEACQPKSWEDLFPSFRLMDSARKEFDSIEQWLVNQQAAPDSGDDYILELSGKQLCLVPLSVLQGDVKSHVFKNFRQKMKMELTLQAKHLDEEELTSKIQQEVCKAHPEAKDVALIVDTAGSSVTEERIALSISDELQKSIPDLRQNAAALFRRYALEYCDDVVYSESWETEKSKIEKKLKKVCDQVGKKKKGDQIQKCAKQLTSFAGRTVSVEELNDENKWRKLQHELRSSLDNLYKLRESVGKEMEKCDALQKYECRLFILVDETNHQRIAPQYQIVPKAE